MSDHETRSDQKPMTSKLLRGAIWIAIGALIAAALVCVVWVLIGDQDGIIGRAFLTILLLALFAGIAIAESHLAERRPDWLALASMITWIIALLVGAVKIWLPTGDNYYGWVMERFFQFLLVIGILQLALVHVRLFLKASQRYVTTFTRVIVMVTFAMLGGLVAMLVFYLTFPDTFDYRDLYWRIVIALAILAAVGTTLIPLLNALFAPRPRQAFTPSPALSPIEPTPAPRAWPTYSDGRTPLPVLPDGSPDWNAYYTGRPTYDPQVSVPSFPILDAPVQPSAPQQAPVPQQPPAPAPQQSQAPAAPQTPAPAAPQAPAYPAEPTAQPQPTAQPPAQPQPPEQPPAPPAPPVPPYAAEPPAPGSIPPPPPAAPGAPTTPGAPQ